MLDGIIWAILFCLGVSAGWAMCGDSWQRDMVTRGYAEHSQMTGKWQWKAVP